MLTESGNCSDVWNVSYSSAHNTTGSRGGTRTLIRQNSLLSSFPVQPELIVLHHAVSGKRYGALLPSVHSSESGVGIRSYHASDPLLVFAAVKKMAPSSREAIKPSVQKFPMHAFSLVSPGVGWCATNEVVQFFVCCATFDLRSRS